MILLELDKYDIDSGKFVWYNPVVNFWIVNTKQGRLLVRRSRYNRQRMLSVGEQFRWKLPSNWETRLTRHHTV